MTEDYVARKGTMLVARYSRTSAVVRWRRWRLRRMKRNDTRLCSVFSDAHLAWTGGGRRVSRGLRRLFHTRLVHGPQTRIVSTRAKSVGNRRSAAEVSSEANVCPAAHRVRMATDW